MAVIEKTRGPSGWPRCQRQGPSTETIQPLEAVVLLPVEVVLVGVDLCIHLDFRERRSLPGHPSHPPAGTPPLKVGPLWPRSSSPWIQVPDASAVRRSMSTTGVMGLATTGTERMGQSTPIGQPEFHGDQHPHRD